MQTSVAPILLGCCPSSGSTLLSVMLDAHPHVLSGPELTWLGHGAVWRDADRDWRARLQQAITAPQSSREPSRPELFCPWVDFIDQGNLAWYGWELEELARLVGRVGCVEELVGTFFERALRRRGKRRWVDKSPTNSYGIPAMLERVPGARALVLVRDGRDTVCSLIRRGFALGAAGAVWLAETARCLELAADPRVLLVRFEDLVSDPRRELDRVRDHLDLEAGLEEMLDFVHQSERAVEDASIRVEAWTVDPSRPLDAGVVGRWPDVLSPETVTWLAGLRGPGEHSFGGLMTQLGYSEESESAGMRGLDPVGLIQAHLRGSRDLTTRCDPFHARLVDWSPGALELRLDGADLARLIDQLHAAATGELADLQAELEVLRAERDGWKLQAEARVPWSGGGRGPRALLRQAARLLRRGRTAGSPDRLVGRT